MAPKKTFTKKPRKFLEEFPQDLNATRAGKLAGVTTSVADQPKFQRFLTRLEQLASVDIRKMFDQHNNAIDIADLPADVRACIAGFEITEECEGRGADRKSVGSKKVKLVDPRAAILALSKLRGFSHDKDERPQSPLEKVPTKNVMTDHIWRSPSLILSHTTSP